MAVYTQVTTYEQGVADGDLQNSNTNILAIQFSQPVTGGRLTAWDTNAHSTTAKEIFGDSGEMGTNSWMRAGVTATDVLPTAGAGSLPGTWNSQTKTTTTFQLDGDTYYVSFGAIATAGNQVRFVITCYVPNDAGAGTTGHDPVWTCRYTYTGSAPTVTWYLNTGTEGTPTWTELTSAYAHYGTGPDSTTSALDPVQAPASGIKFPEEWWFQTGA